MHAHTTTPLRWQRALVWSEHDAWMARRRARQVVLLCIGLCLLMMAFVRPSWAFNRLVLAAVFPQAAQPRLPVPTPAAIPYHPSCCDAPPCAWFPSW